MKIEQGKKVIIEYTLFVDGPNGEIVEETTSENPFVFVFKEEPMLEEFEKQLEGLEKGGKFSFPIACDDAYGQEEEDAIVSFEKSTFMVDGEIDEEALMEGEVIEMEDDEGNTHFGLVVENDKETVLLDFNHPLAGCDIYFDGQVIDVQ